MPTEALRIDVIATTSNAEAGMKRIGDTAEAELGSSGKLGKAGKEAESALGGVGGKSGKLADDLGKDAAKSGGALEKVGVGANNLLSSFTGLSLSGGPLTMVIGGVVAGLVGLGAVGVGVFSAWNKNEEAVTTLNQAMKDAGEKVTPQWTKAMRDAQVAGENLGFGQSETTSTLGALTLAGLNQKQALAQLPVIMDLARAKNLSLADATAVYVKGIAGAGKGLKDLNIIGLETLPTTASIAAGHAALAKAITKYGANSVQAKAEQEKLNTTLNIAAVRAHNLTVMHDELNKKVGGEAIAHTHDLGTEWSIVTSKFNDMAGQAIPYVLGALSDVGKALGVLIGWIGTYIVPVVSTVFGIVATIIGTEIKIAVAIISTAIGVIINVIKTLAGPVTAIVKTIGGIIGTIGGFFTTVFGGVSKTIGGFAGAIANAVKAVVNPIITIVDTFIGFINVLISGVDKVIGAIPFVGSKLQIPQIPKISQLAAGGIVSATPGGILALLGEGGHDEAVSPLPSGWQSGSSQRPGAGGGTVVNVNVQSQADPNQISRAVVWGLRARARVA